MIPSLEQIRSEFEAISGGAVLDLNLIAGNKYCQIFRGVRDGKPAIYKKYLTGDPGLVQNEYQSINLYHSIVHEDPVYIDSRGLGVSDANRTLAIEFVPGGRLSDHLAGAAKTGGAQARKRAVWMMAPLGALLKQMRLRTIEPARPLDPFHAEYITYSARRLRKIPVLGQTHFARIEEHAAALVERIGAVAGSSFCHGDFVPRNIHVDGDRVGVIDFANSLFASHPLND